MSGVSPSQPSSADIIRNLRARRIMCDGGNGNVYDIADEECEQAAERIEALETELASCRACRAKVDCVSRTGTEPQAEWNYTGPGLGGPSTKD